MEFGEKLGDAGRNSLVPGTGEDPDGDSYAAMGITDVRKTNCGVLKGGQDRAVTSLGLSPKEDKFARNIAMGGFKNLLEAAKDAGLPITSHKGAINASRSLSIRGAVKRLLEKESDLDTWSMSKAEIILYLEDVLQTPLDEIDTNHKFCVKFDLSESVGEKSVSNSFRKASFSKEKAMDMLIRLRGFNTPETLHISADLGIADLIGQIRSTGGKVIAKEEDPVTIENGYQATPIEEAHPDGETREVGGGQESPKQENPPSGWGRAREADQ